ncbi:MAG: hypothetical protein NC453_30495 [Muribaculum sp.]|nr:hypothetical protein [Muribaculum sp.]
MIDKKDELIMSLVKSVSDAIAKYLGVEPMNPTELKQYLDDDPKPTATVD